jgi:hypothetical protein
VASYLKGQVLQVVVDPITTYRFAIGAEADRTGSFLGRPAKAGGGKATWTVVRNDSVVAVGSLSGTVAGDRTARLPFTTGRETEQQAKGETVVGAAQVRLDVPREELGDLLNLGKEQLFTLGAALTRVLPADVRRVVEPEVRKVIDPVVDRLSKEIANKAGGVFTLTGYGQVRVLHHRPPEARYDDRHLQPGGDRHEPGRDRERDDEA